MTFLEAFNKLKSDLELSQSFQNTITTRHNAIRKWIEKEDPAIETKLIGSLQRQTRIQPINNGEVFDIDILVVFGSFSGWQLQGGISPTDALNKLENIVTSNSRYNKMGPETDSPTISVDYSDNTKVELVPAYKDRVGQTPEGINISPSGRGYWIVKNNKWTFADYDYDADYISNLNSNCLKMIIPTIKMLKCIKRNLFPEISSYHLEVLAVNILPSIITQLTINSNLSYDLLIYHFFNIAEGMIYNYDKIEGSNSVITDAGLDQNKKERLSKIFADIVKYLDSNQVGISETDLIKKWYKIFGQPFSLGV